MTVRAMRPPDADAMAALHAASFDKPWPALDMAVHIQRDLCVGLSDPLQSFAILRCSDIDAEILTVATHPDHRGEGLATAVLEQAQTMVSDRGLRSIFLEVAEDNQSARSLYARLGYAPIGRRPGYYARPEGRMAAITYALSLDAAP